MIVSYTYLSKRGRSTPHHCYLSWRTYVRITLGIVSYVACVDTKGWGFFAHRVINEKAVFLLPPELLPFYKKHLALIREEAVKPDKRRYTIPGEARCHFINLEPYQANGSLPHHWREAYRHYDSDTLDAYGILPWHIAQMKERLTRAFKEKDIARILYLSAHLGHYLADAHVPLHTTENYDGQCSEQHGIHALWESRIPERFADEYDYLFEEPLTYIKDIQTMIWRVIHHTHALSQQVLSIEKAVGTRFPTGKKYVYEQRGTTLTRTYTYAYVSAYHKALDGMVEAQMRASIHAVASLWFTCWVEAGCPDLTQVKYTSHEETMEEDSPEDFLTQKVRPHE